MNKKKETIGLYRPTRNNGVLEEVVGARHKGQRPILSVQCRRCQLLEENFGGAVVARAVRSLLFFLISTLKG